MSESFDIIIIGGGAASAGAALTARSRGKTVGIVANPAETSGLYKAGHITNYPGFDSISGRALALQFRTQTEAAGKSLSRRGGVPWPRRELLRDLRRDALPRQDRRRYRGRCGSAA